MTQAAYRHRQPLALLASSPEGSSRGIESVLLPHYLVTAVFTGPETMSRTRETGPDLIVLDADLPELNGIEVCRRLRTEGYVTASTPVFVTAPGPVDRNIRLAALQAGATDVLPTPTDGEEMLLRFANHVRAKFDADQAREQSLVDPTTELYNLQGLIRRSQEMSHQAARQHTPLSCVVMTAVPGDVTRTDESLVALTDQLAAMLKAAGRLSDALGRIGPTELAVVAPETDAQRALLLAKRLIAALDAAIEPDADRLGNPHVRAGFHSVEGVDLDAFDPMTFLTNAATALAQSRADPAASRIHRYHNGST